MVTPPNRDMLFLWYNYIISFFKALFYFFVSISHYLIKNILTNYKPFIVILIINKLFILKFQFFYFFIILCAYSMQPGSFLLKHCSLLLKPFHFRVVLILQTCIVNFCFQLFEFFINVVHLFSVVRQKVIFMLIENFINLAFEVLKRED